MNEKSASDLKAEFSVTDAIGDGKTKTIYGIQNNPELVALVSKDDITAGDGKKHDIIPNKGRLATTTTSNVFRLLKECGLPVAFVSQRSENSFVAQKCEMLPYEVVVRREAHGSYCKRYPHIAKGQLFPKLVVEFFLKTKGRDWKGKALICDDPLMRNCQGAGTIELYDPAAPLQGQKPFLVLSGSEVFGHAEEWKRFPEMAKHAENGFLVLEKAWQLLGRRLVDYKVEFGFDTNGHLLLADVVDNDSWRLLENGAYVDKQVYRDGGGLNEVAENYRRVADLTDRFELPRQRIILWRGSDKDDRELFFSEGGELKDLMETVTCSVHKEPVRATQIFQQMVHEVPDSVVIAYVGRSNGAGPVLSAASTIPAITVPASVKDFPADIWSSLRMPSDVPVMTVLEPANAVLAALNILSARNPRIYAHLRSRLEQRMTDAAS